ncbi:hypothetical protein BKA62DRAFT_630129 [Auriculariales sp. MPI-PUGE-AT-0066]|nr:hypothetical protein BKA62DRAFT_630129 [Auriculariales sp. MPI-PUGE-AT-0066]
MASGSRATLAAFFDDDDMDDDVSPSVPVKKTEIEELKLNQFSHGINKKSKRDKEREAAENKKLQEEQDAAIAYAEFVQSFEGDTSKRGSASFVRAGEARCPAPSVHRRSWTTWMRQPHPRTNQGANAPWTRISKRSNGDLSHALPPRASSSTSTSEQAERESRLRRSSESQGRSVSSIAATELQSGSRDRGDPETSNLFVANLPLHITEPVLGAFFSRHGPVGSVKIMWPRAADGVERRQNAGKGAGLSGFVSFMKRKDAEDALREFDGFDWGGSVLRVGWSKAVPLAPKALYDTKGAMGGSKDVERSTERSSRHRDKDRHSRSRSRSRERKHSHSRSRDRRSRSRSRDRTRHHHGSRRSYSRSRSRSRSRSPRRRSHTDSRRSRSRSRSRDQERRHKSRSRSPPKRTAATGETEETESFMRMTAAMAREHGRQFEDTLREREDGKPHYAFLWDDRSRYHRAYRRLVESNHDVDDAFNDDGAHSVYSTDSGEESERERSLRGRLGPLARKRFECMLRGLSGRRGELGRAMVFALDHAEAAGELADAITAALLVDGTPVPRKLARLFLVCDILHNSAASVPFAWKFRAEFQARLGLVFDHLSTIYHSFPGRITAETFKRQITSVVEVWEDWIVFPPEFTAELRMRLDGVTSDLGKTAEVVETVEVAPVEPATEPKFRSSAFRPVMIQESIAATAADDVDGAPLDDVDGEPMDDVDGVPMDDVDGEPMDDLDGAPLDDDLDGAPLNEDVDGAPLPDEDVDGAALEDADVDGKPTVVDSDDDDRMHESD